MAGSYYILGINKLVTWLVPPRQRFVLFTELVKVAATPLSFVYQLFTNYRLDIDYRLLITPQVCYLEKIINDSFDKEQRRINISDALNYQVILIHTDEAQIPLMTHQDNQGTYYDESIPVIHDVSAYADSGNDFYVNVPFTLTNTQEHKLKNIINTYKLASKRYKIIYT